MAVSYIGKIQLPFSNKTRKTGDRPVLQRVSGFRFQQLPGLGGRRRAVSIERALKLLGNRRSGRGLDRRTLHQVDQLAVAQNGNRRRGRRMSAKVATRLLSRVAVLSCEHR